MTSDEKRLATIERAALLERPALKTSKHSLKLLGIATGAFTAATVPLILQAPALIPIWLLLIALASIPALLLLLGIGGTVDVAQAIRRRSMIRTRQKDRDAGLLSAPADEESGRLSETAGD